MNYEVAPQVVFRCVVVILGVLQFVSSHVLQIVVPADYVSAGHVLVPAGSSSSVPADYVSAGHVLVPADRDRIC
ncbi:hypothetical protein Tco_0326407 [Tanacetum coccineum]